MALLKLENPLKFNGNTSAIDMIDDGVEIEEGATAIVTGWGHLKVSNIHPKIRSTMRDEESAIKHFK